MAGMCLEEDIGVVRDGIDLFEDLLWELYVELLQRGEKWEEF